MNIYVAEEQEKNNNRSQEVKASDIAVMTVDLTEGLRKLGGAVQSEADKYAGKSYFPYVTPYSQTNTGFMPAPEPNDRVALYFPSENETHALVMGAVNNNGNGRFTNPDKRNFTLGPSQAAKGGTPANEGKPMYNFTLDSEKFIVNVGNLISLTSNGTAQMTAKSNIDLTSTDAIATLRGKSYVKAIAIENAELMAKNVNVGLGEGGKANQTKIKGTKLVEIDSEQNLSATGKVTASVTATEGDATFSGKRTGIGIGKVDSTQTVVAGTEVDVN